jgi:phage terminase large subunit-like protein
MLAFQACRKKDLNIEDFKGRPCYVAVDLATKTDIAAVMTLFPPENGGKWAAFGRYYLPEDTINDNQRYQAFHAGGWLQSTPGNVIDYEIIEDHIRDMSHEYQIKEIPFDPFQATYFVTRMMSEGFPMVEVGATIKNFSDPMMTLEALILEKKIDFQIDPVLLWMFGNVVAKTTMNKAKEVIFPDKERAESKIDGVVALIMALNRALPFEQEKRSVYDTRGILSFDNTATAPAIIEQDNAPI